MRVEHSSTPVIIRCRELHHSVSGQMVTKPATIAVMEQEVTSRQCRYQI